VARIGIGKARVALEIAGIGAGHLAPHPALHRRQAFRAELVCGHQCGRMELRIGGNGLCKMFNRKRSAAGEMADGAIGLVHACSKPGNGAGHVVNRHEIEAGPGGYRNFAHQPARQKGKGLIHCIELADRAGLAVAQNNRRASDAMDQPAGPHHRFGRGFAAFIAIGENGFWTNSLLGDLAIAQTANISGADMQQCGSLRAGKGDHIARARDIDRGKLIIRGIEGQRGRAMHHEIHFRRLGKAEPGRTHIAFERR